MTALGSTGGQRFRSTAAAPMASGNATQRSMPRRWRLTTPGASATSSYICQPRSAAGRRSLGAGFSAGCGAGALADATSGAGIRPVVDEAIGRIDAAELAGPAETDAHRSPVVGLGDVDHRDVAGDRAAHAGCRPVGMLDLDLARIDHAADHRDMAKAHAAVRAEGQHAAGFGYAAAGIDAGRVVPPLSRRCR